MEKSEISRLTRELKRKQFQFNSIFEFSESIYSSFDQAGIMRICFSTLMGQLGVTRIFLYDSHNGLFERRGMMIGADGADMFERCAAGLGSNWFCLRIEEIPGDGPQDRVQLKAFLEQNKIAYLVNLTDDEERTAVLAMGARFNGDPLSEESIEYAFFVSRFSLGAVENALLVSKLIENNRMEHELKIARDIQLSLLPQEIPGLDHFELSVIYRPTNEVGGDYYDILKSRKGQLPVLIADVEGKGLPAALLAASSQAVFHSLNELYRSAPDKFISKANALIHDFTRGERFITLFWMLVDDERRRVTYVNAGHIEPLWISPRRDDAVALSRGGLLTGFLETVGYEQETLELQSGDIIMAFTDGVPEVENKAGEMFGTERMVQLVRENSHLGAEELTAALFDAIHTFSENTKFRDDFTLIILKAK